MADCDYSIVRLFDFAKVRWFDSGALLDSGSDLFCNGWIGFQHAEESASDGAEVAVGIDSKPLDEMVLPVGDDDSEALVSVPREVERGHRG